MKGKKPANSLAFRRWKRSGEGLVKEKMMK